MNATENTKVHTRRKVRRKMKAKQLVDWQTLADPIFVSLFDVQQLIVNRTKLSDGRLTRAVNSVWEGKDYHVTCFELGLYWVDGEKITKAEAMLKYVRAGVWWREAERRFNSCLLVAPAESRDPSDDWWRNAIAREIAAKRPPLVPVTPNSWQ